MINNTQIAQQLLLDTPNTATLLREFHLALDEQEYMIINLMVTTNNCGIAYSFHTDVILGEGETVGDDSDDSDDTTFIRYTEEVYEELIELLEDDEDDREDDYEDNYESQFMDHEQPDWSKY